MEATPLFRNNMYVETTIIGGGHCGVNLALNLQEKGADYLVLEKESLLSQWKHARWDDFRLNTPHGMNRLYGQTDDIDDHSLAEFSVEMESWEQHIQESDIRVEEHQKVVSLVEADDEEDCRFKLKVQPKGGPPFTIATDNVVCCSGQHAIPRTPSVAENLPNHLIEVHSNSFKGPQQFPDDSKAILVVGSGQSGCQIADLLADHGKQVYLCTGKTSGMFRSYRGEDAFVWCKRMGTLDMTNEARKQLPGGEAMRYAGSPVVGATKPISYFSLARKGVQILGSLESIQGSRLLISRNRAENARYLKESHANLRKVVRNWIQGQPDDVAKTFNPETQEDQIPEPEWETLDYLLASNGPRQLSMDNFQGVVWCTGYQSSVKHYMDIPMALDQDMNQRTGSPDAMISESVPGLYYAGFPWVHSAGSAVLMGFQGDAQVLVDHLLQNSNSSNHQRRPLSPAVISDDEEDEDDEGDEDRSLFKAD
jgi:putative flavoprotein involved in K+ transport